MRKNAFTLIELLAVIVILAIIALIAVPIVINIINDSKNSSDEQSVELYLDTVEKAITKKQLSNPKFNPDKCEIQDNGDLKCYKNDELIDTIQIEMKGKMPEDGVIKIENNKFKFKNILYNNKIYYESYAKLIQDNNSNGKPDIGDKYTYKVNKTDTFSFYVLSFNDDDTVNLIMDRNICEDGSVDSPSKKIYCRYFWHRGVSDNNYGPDTAMSNLYQATKDWINVPDMVMNYIDEANGTSTDKGYTSIMTDKVTKLTMIIGKNEASNTTIDTASSLLKARLPKYSEVTEAGCTGSNGSCPAWLVEKLKYFNINNDKYIINNSKDYEAVVGYWLLSSSNNELTRARVIYYEGYRANAGTYDGGYGIRPVITVPISNLE